MQEYNNFIQTHKHNLTWQEYNDFTNLDSTLEIGLSGNEGIYEIGNIYLDTSSNIERNNTNLTNPSLYTNQDIEYIGLRTYNRKSKQFHDYTKPISKQNLKAVFKDFNKFFTDLEISVLFEAKKSVGSYFTLKNIADLCVLSTCTEKEVLNNA